MASRIQGITVEIGGDTTKLSKAGFYRSCAGVHVKAGRLHAWHPRQILRPDAQAEAGAAGRERQRLVCRPGAVLHDPLHGLRQRQDGQSIAL